MSTSPNAAPVKEDPNESPDVEPTEDNPSKPDKVDPDQPVNPPADPL